MTYTVWGSLPTDNRFWVSIEGRVINNDWNRNGSVREVIPSTATTGHKIVSGVGLVHRAMSFVFPMLGTGTLVCHKNDVPSDNRIENLYKGTHSDNLYDAYRNKRTTGMKGNTAWNKGIGREVTVTIDGKDIVLPSLGEAAKIVGYANPASMQQGIEANRGRAKKFRARYTNES